MAYRFEFDAVNKIIAIRFSGRITFEFFKQFYLTEIPKRIGGSDFRGSISDFSDVTLMDFTPQQVRELASYPPADPDPSRMRVIVAPSAHIFGLCRMFELHGEETRPNLHVVSNLNQAYALLQITNPKFEADRETSRA